jgi:hypothetical protein
MRSNRLSKPHLADAALSSDKHDLPHFNSTPSDAPARRADCPIAYQLGPDVTLFAAWRTISVQLAF